MSKHKHRRTQSNSEVDLRNALCQQDDKKHFIEIFHHASQAQTQIPEKEVIIEKLEDDYSLQHLKENCGLNFGNVKRKSNIGQQLQSNNLFLIPEQNDLLSSVEQTQESGKKLHQNSKLNLHMQKRPTHSVEQKQNNDQKENKKNEHIRQNSSLITQIAQLRDVTQLINNDKQEPQNKMSFTKELQKKKLSYPTQVPYPHQQQTNQIIQQNFQLNLNNVLQMQNTNQQNNTHKNSQKDSVKNSTTPDRKRTPSMVVNKPSGVEAPFQKSDKQTTQESDKLKNNLSVSIFNNLFSQNKKISISGSTNKQEAQNDSFRKLENQMKKLEKEIYSLKQRQDQQDQINQTIQQQLVQVINDSRKQREQGHLQLKKLEQLEIITRRNEESILCLRQTLGGCKRNDQTTTHQTDSTELSDQHRRFTDLKTLNRYL